MKKNTIITKKTHDSRSPLMGSGVRAALRLSSSGIVLGMMVLGAMPLPQLQIPAAYAADPQTPTDPPAPPAWPTYTVGGQIMNPETGAMETITEIDGAAATTSFGNIILMPTIVGNEYRAPDSNNVLKDYVVVAVTEQNGRITGVTVIEKGASDIPANRQSVNILSTRQSSGDGSDASGAQDVVYTPATGDKNAVQKISQGNSGGSGADGGGVRVCIPLIGCATIGKSPSRGGGGSDAGEIVDYVVPATHPDIETITNKRAGITIQSIGGNGGKGGDGYGVNIPGASGGKAGHGGNVTATTHANVTTKGAEAHGIFVQSRSGVGGKGGSGYILSGGGDGGGPGQGGHVTLTNTGRIITEGEGAIGILAQSLSGQAGAGGSSYGIVGFAPGDGSIGGNAGSVELTHSGDIYTKGIDAHGILAQSIGGDGGRAVRPELSRWAGMPVRAATPIRSKSPLKKTVKFAPTVPDRTRFWRNLSAAAAAMAVWPLALPVWVAAAARAAMVHPSRSSTMAH